MSLGPPGAQGACISGRRNAKITAEQALEMVRCVAYSCRELGKSQGSVCSLDELHRLRHSFAIATDLVGPTAQACAITGTLRFLCCSEEFDMFTFRVARGAAWLAIDAGGFHRPNEVTVARAVACFEGGPSCFRVNHEQ